MTNFEQMEKQLIEAGRIIEAARINQRSLTWEDRDKIFESRVSALGFGLSEPMIQSYMEDGAEQARTVLR